MSCPFCAIASGESPAALVFRSAECVAFLDHRPLFPGHCLLIPTQHIETLPDLPPQLQQPLFAAAGLLCRAVEEALQAPGSFVAINNRVSQSVPHLHVHVVPRRPKDGLRGFFWPRTRYRDDSHLGEIRQSIAAAIDRLKEPRTC